MINRLLLWIAAILGIDAEERVWWECSECHCELESYEHAEMHVRNMHPGQPYMIDQLK